MDFEKWYESCKLLLNLGFDLDKNSARDLLGAINDVYDYFEEYTNSSVKS